MKNCRKSGFSLVELSIVLVIIGLLAGGVLVGRDLIKAATIRSQISQIEKYNTAVNTFKLKYGYLPGDLPPTEATAVGFITRLGTVGRGDGNGIIEQGAANYKSFINAGEAALFWADLGDSGLIGTKYNGIDCTSGTSSCAYSSATIPVSSILPPANIGQNNYIAVFYSVYKKNSFMTYANMRVLDSNGATGSGFQISGKPTSGISPIQAYKIDGKIDDGLPLTGRVITYGNVLGSTTFLGTCPAGIPSAGLCCNNSTSPTSYNILEPYGIDISLCSVSFALQ